MRSPFKLRSFRGFKNFLFFATVKHSTEFKIFSHKYSFSDARMLVPVGRDEVDAEAAGSGGDEEETHPHVARPVKILAPKFALVRASAAVKSKIVNDY